MQHFGEIQIHEYLQNMKLPLSAPICQTSKILSIVTFIKYCKKSQILITYQIQDIARGKLFFINACKRYDVFIEVKSFVILLGHVWLQSRCFPHNLNLMDLNLNGSGCRALSQFCKNSIWRVNGLMKLRTSIQSLKL